MLEKLSEIDDGFMDAFLHGKEITEADVRRVIRKGTLEGSILPVLCGTAFKNKGMQPLLDAIVDYLPCPTDVSPVRLLERRRRRKAIYRARSMSLSAASFSRS